MVVLALLGTAALLYGLHRKGTGHLHALVALAIAAIASGGTWAMVIRTARLPRAMTATHQQDKSIHYPVGISDRELYLRGDNGLVHVELPSLRIHSVLPWNGPHPGVVSTVAWSGRVLLVMWHDGGKGRFAMASGDAWVVPPRSSPDDDASATAYWDRNEKVFVLSSRLAETYTKRTFTFMDETGAEVRKLVVAAANIELIAARGMCQSGDDLVATGWHTCRTKAPITVDATWTCNGNTTTACPGHFDWAGGPAAWFTAAGAATYPALPTPLASVFEHRAYDKEVLLEANGVTPRDARIGTDFSALVRIHDGFVRTRLVDDKEAVRLGHTSHREMLVERYDFSGKLLGVGWIMNPPFRSWVVPAGDEIAILSDELDGVARFDAKTMERRDPPGVIASLRDRLERWGGPSGFFRAGLAATLATAALLPLIAIAWFVSRRRPTSDLALWLPRVLALLAVTSVTTLVATLVRYFYL